MQPALFEISSESIACTLGALGASIASVRVRSARGTWTQVALSPESLWSGAPDPSLAGRTIAPCCGRVRGGAIDVDGAPHRLSLNDGPNHIHGGFEGAAHQLWTAEQVSATCVRFSLRLPHGLDGYPGDRALTAEYAVEGAALSVVYTACTDRATWLDMTSHAYWDLSGRFDGGALGQRLEIPARRVVYNGEGHLPQSVEPAAGAFDFRRPARLCDSMRLGPAHAQLALGRGYNNAFLLDKGAVYGVAARLSSSATGIAMTMESDRPAVVLYSGGFLGADTPLRGGGHASPGCAVALEAQGAPDPFHLPGAEPALLRPGDAFHAKICWRFASFI